MRTEIKRETRVVRSKLLKQRHALSRERTLSPVRASRTRAVYPIRHKAKASETRQAQYHCSTRRHAVYAWLSSLSALTGDIQRLPREQRGTSTEFRLSNLHPAIRIFVSGTTLAASVHYQGGSWDLLKYFEALPQKVAQGWINVVSAPGRQRVYSSVDALWKAEVLHRFRDWFELILTAAEAVTLYGTDDGATWAELMPFAAPRDSDEMARFPVWMGRARAAAHEMRRGELDRPRTPAETASPQPKPMRSLLVC